jgi:hypothetical protein
VNKLLKNSFKMGIIFKNFSPGSDSPGPPSPDSPERTELVDHTTAEKCPGLRKKYYGKPTSRYSFVSLVLNVLGALL